MSESVGHIKLDRKILNWEWYTDHNVFHLFIYLILKANWKDGRWKGVLVKRGQLITGRLKLSIDTGLSEREIRTCISKLKTTNEIIVKATSQYSIITICKYDTYQNKNEGIDQVNDQQIDSQTTNERPTSDQRATTIEEELRRIKKNKEDIGENFISEIPVNENSIISKMINIFKRQNKFYPDDQVKDSGAILQIAIKIGKSKNLEQHDILNGKMKDVLSEWESIVEFISNDKWFSTRALFDINNEWQRVIQTKNATGINLPKKKLSI